MSQILNTPISIPGEGTVTDVTGGNNITITGVSTVDPIVNVSGTENNSLLVGNSTGSISNLGLATNGQIPIGSTGAAPVLATITAGSNITVTNGAGTITIAASNSTPDSFITDDGTATASSNELFFITGVDFYHCGSSVEFTGSTNVVTLNVTDLNANTIIGSLSGNATIAGEHSSGVGADSLGALTAGSNNSFCGFNSMNLLTSGAGNSTLGSNVLENLLTGNNNIVLGDGAGSNYTSSESNNILIDNAGGVGDSETIRIGFNQTSCYIKGIDAVNVGSVATVVTEASNQLGTAVITAGSGITVTPSANAITIAASGSSIVSTLTGNSGDAVSPTVGNTNFVGDGSFVTIVGNPGTHTLTASLVHSSVTLSNGNNITVTGSPLSLGGTASFNLTGTTNNSLQIGNAGGSLTSLGVATNGQIPIGSTGTTPVLSTITAGANITVTNGAGVITIASAASTGTVTSLTAGTGITLTPSPITTTGSIALTIPVTVPDGGTGQITNTNHGVLLGQGASAIIATSVGATNTVLLGNTGADPSFGTVPNAALTNDSVTLSSGNNITVTGGGPLVLGGTASFNLTGTTQFALQVGNAGGSLTSLPVGATNTVLLGNTGANPSFGTVSNAALTNSSITLANGNNITVTGSPVSLGGTATIAVTGTTNNSLLIGNATGSITSLGVATNGQIPIGSTGATPVLATITAGANITVTNGAGVITIASSPGGSGTVTSITAGTGITLSPSPITTTGSVSLTVPVVVSSGGTGAITLTGVLIGNGTSAVTGNAITQYDVLVGGASNAIASVSPSTAGFVLTSNGTSADPSFQAISSSTSALHLIQTQTASAVSSLVFSTGITTTYNNYLFLCRNLLTTSSGTPFFGLQLSSNGGSTYITSGYSGVFSSMYFATPLTTGTNGAYAQIFNFTSGVGSLLIMGQSFNSSNTTSSLSTYYATPTVVNAFKVVDSAGGNITGVFSLYGYNF